MRRIASYLLSVVIALSGITALAVESEVKDVYNHSENSVSASEAGVTGKYSTVMIKTMPKDGENAEVVYINQESGVFSDLTTFLMKEDCADGKTCYGYFELPEPYTTVTGYASIAYGLQIFNIPEEKKDLNLYLGGAPE